MAGMLYGFPFNEELFNYRWRNEPDLVSTALVESGAVVNNAEIAGMVSNGSDLYTIPFYKTIGGTPANYDGNTDIPVVDTEGGYQSGIVFGRTQAWRERDFTVDYNRADPMGQIVSQVAKFWAKYDQALILKILNAVFGITPGTGYEQWSEHVLDISTASTVADANKVGATTFGDAAVKACGDAANGAFGLAFMHSQVANRLAGLELLEFAKYTDERGIERPLPLGYINGYTCVVTDQVPVDTTGTAPKYTSYLLGAGAIQKADANVERPSELVRDALTNGGQTVLATRVRKTFHPNGFSYTKGANDGPSPTDAMLGTAAKWAPIYDPKSIAMAKVVSNG